MWYNSVPSFRSPVGFISDCLTLFGNILASIGSDAGAIILNFFFSALVVWLIFGLLMYIFRNTKK